MQSLNEELQTVNVELQSKVDELSRTNDMKNLLNSTDIATLFLDNWLNIRRFTTQVTKIMSLIQADVGRPVTDLSSNLNYPGLSSYTNDVLQTLVTSEKAVSTKSGIWYNVRMENTLRESERKLNLALDNGEIGIWEYEPAAGIISLDERMRKMLGVRNQSYKKPFKSFEKLINEEDIKLVREAFRKTVKNSEPLDTVFRSRDQKSGTKHLIAKGLLYVKG